MEENKNTSASTVYQKRKKRKGISRPSNESFCLLLTAFETPRATAVDHNTTSSSSTFLPRKIK
uniref:Uncharacterized protein n=1 Tax=Manihot esculenta TaxID=3983 RepID=A0A2C9WAF2_MANES